MSSDIKPENPVVPENPDESVPSSSDANFASQVPQESNDHQNGEQEETNENVQGYEMDVEGAEYAMDGDQTNQEGDSLMYNYATDVVPLYQRIDDPICHEHSSWEDPNLFWNPSIEPIIYPDEYHPPNTLEDALKETKLSKETAAMMVNLCANIPDGISPYLWLLIESEDMRSLFTEKLMMPCNLERLPWKGLLYNTLCALRSLQKGIGTFYCVETRFKQLTYRRITWNSFLYVTEDSNILSLKDDDQYKTIYVLEDTIAYYVMPSFFIVEPSSSFYIQSFTRYNNTMIVYMKMNRDNGEIRSIFPNVGPSDECDEEEMENEDDGDDKRNERGEDMSEKEKDDEKKLEYIPVSLVTVLAKLVDFEVFTYLGYLLGSYSGDLEFKIRILNLMKLLSLAGYNKMSPDIDRLYNLFTDSIDDPISTRYLVEIFKAFSKNYELSEKLASTNIEGTIYEFLYNKYKNISMCDYLSSFLLYLYSTCKPFQNKLKDLDDSQIGLIIEIASNMEYAETATLANILSIIFLIPVSNEKTCLFIGIIKLVVESIQKGSYEREFTMNALKAFSTILKYPELADTFLKCEGLEIVLNQFQDPSCTEKDLQSLFSVLKFLSYDESSIECLEYRNVTNIVLCYLRNFPTSPLICEPGLIILRNILKRRNSQITITEQDCSLEIISIVFKSNPQNIIIAKKTFGIIQKVAFLDKGQNAISKRVPDMLHCMVEFLKRNYKESVSLCINAMCALRNMAAGEFVFKLAPFLQPNEIIPLSFEIMRSYPHYSQVCLHTCAFLWNASASIIYGKEIFERGGTDELMTLMKKNDLEGEVSKNAMGVLINLWAFGFEKEKLTLFFEDIKKKENKSNE